MTPLIHRRKAPRPLNPPRHTAALALGAVILLAGGAGEAEGQVRSAADTIQTAGPRPGTAAWALRASLLGPPPQEDGLDEALWLAGLGGGLPGIGAGGAGVGAGGAGIGSRTPGTPSAFPRPGMPGTDRVGRGAGWAGRFVPLAVSGVSTFVPV